MKEAVITRSNGHIGVWRQTPIDGRRTTDELTVSTSLHLHLHIPEHKSIVANAQGLAASRGHISEYNFPGYDIGEFFPVGIVGHFRIEIGKNSGALVILRVR